MSRRFDIGGVAYFHLKVTSPKGDVHVWARSLDPSARTSIPCDANGWIDVADYPPGKYGSREQILCAWRTLTGPAIGVESRGELPGYVERWQPLPGTYGLATVQVSGGTDDA